jgi:hypothetical protein
LNVAAYKWKLHNGKFEVISFVVKNNETLRQKKLLQFRTSLQFRGVGQGIQSIAVTIKETIIHWMIDVLIPHHFTKRAGLCS